MYNHFYRHYSRLLLQNVPHRYYQLMYNPPILQILLQVRPRPPQILSAYVQPAYFTDITPGKATSPQILRGLLVQISSHHSTNSVKALTENSSIILSKWKQKHSIDTKLRKLTHVKETAQLGTSIKTAQTNRTGNTKVTAQTACYLHCRGKASHPSGFRLCQTVLNKQNQLNISKLQNQTEYSVPFWVRCDFSLSI